MSTRHIVTAICISSVVLLLANLAKAEDKAIDLNSAGTAGASDIGYNLCQDCSSNRNCGQNCEQNCGQNCDQNCDQNCGCGNDCCGQPLRSWVFGVEATYLEIESRDRENFGMQPGPLVWLGVEAIDGWGARVRYWQTSGKNFAFNQPILTPGDTVDELIDLDMFTIDAEVTKHGEIGSWDVLASFGGRFAELRKLIAADVFSPSTAESEFNVQDINANAGGITLGLELTRPIGSSGIEVYGGLRVSDLWGNASLDSITCVIQSGVGHVLPFSAQKSIDLTIWEAQVGLQCSKDIVCWKGTAFARCGFEYQGWNFTPGKGVLDSLDMYGLACAVGFTR